MNFAQSQQAGYSARGKHTWEEAEAVSSASDGWRKAAQLVSVPVRGRNQPEHELDTVPGTT